MWLSTTLRGPVSSWLMGGKPGWKSNFLGWGDQLGLTALSLWEASKLFQTDGPGPGRVGWDGWGWDGMVWDGMGAPALPLAYQPEAGLAGLGWPGPGMLRQTPWQLAYAIHMQIYANICNQFAEICNRMA